MKKNRSRTVTFVVIIIAIAGVIWYLESMKVQPAGNGGQSSAGTLPAALIASSSTTAGSISPSQPFAALAAIAAADKKNGDKPGIEIVDPTGFVNASDTFTLSSLIGKKVILVDFWTYSCINCIRTIPYLNSWYQKYHDDGLEIVGIHTPEFDFEKDINNVKTAVQNFGIQYPVILDSNYGTWDAYGNLYWPHEYLIDIAGYIVHDQVGEGDYDGTESAIQNALKQRAQALGENFTAPSITMPNDANIQAFSPETYFGSNRNEYLGNGTQSVAGIQSFVAPTTFAQNTLYLSGTWNINPEYAETPASIASSSVGFDAIDYRYQAKGVYLVAGSSDAPVDVEALIDGKPIDPSVKGSDVFYRNGHSYITVQENRLYRIIDANAASSHLLQLIITSPGFQAFTFTFG